MGSSIKAAAGLALAIFAPQLAPMLVGAGASATVLALTTAAITLVGASISGSALAPDAGDIGGVDSYSGIKLQTQKSNINPVPEVYGYHRLAGNIVYQTTNAAVSNDDAANGYNRDYWAIIVMAGHTIEDIVKIFANDDEMTSLGSNKFKLEYVHIKWYDASSTATNVQSIDFVTDTTGATSTGATLNLDSVDIPKDTAFLAVHQVFDGQQNKNTQMANVATEIKGKKIRTITDASTISTVLTYSTNPVEIALDLLTDGLSIADADIDISVFYQAKTDCDTYGWACNIALIQQANIQSIMQDVLATCRGQIVHSDSKWKLKIDTKNQPTVVALTNDDFINNSLNISMKGNREIANKIILKYINPTDQWLSAQVVKEDTDLQDLDSQTLSKTLDIKGVTNQTQANQLAEITLNTMRYSEDVSGNRVKQTPLAISFGTTVKNADLEVGDVVSINSDLLDRVRKFVILSTETDQSGLIQITGREYCETHYKNSSGSYLI